MKTYLRDVAGASLGIMLTTLVVFGVIDFIGQVCTGGRFRFIHELVSLLP